MADETRRVLMPSAGVRATAATLPVVREAVIVPKQTRILHAAIQPITLATGVYLNTGNLDPIADLLMPFSYTRFVIDSQLQIHRGTILNSSMRNPKSL